MGAGKPLTDEEKGFIKASIQNGLGNSETARRIGRSECVVRNFLKMGDLYGTKKSPGRPSKLTNRAKRNIFKLATVDHLNPKKIIQRLGLPVKTRRVQQVLGSNANAEWLKRKAKPGLKSHHKIRRLEFAKKYIDFRETWKKVIFSDEVKSRWSRLRAVLLA